MEKQKLYFGHPINTYDTALEHYLLAIIREFFDEYWIENPNRQRHMEGYQKWKCDTGRGMDYYFNEVLPDCRAGIFLPFRDGAWGAGVFAEAEFLFEKGCRIWMIDYRGAISGVDLKKVSVLLVKDTVARIRTLDGKRVPY